ncbi:MAG: hypothetical protein GY707_09225 [Desulfobacteraceae bacterium]|nr:hypothetical protein [Desulfobacteraceae bacterium]
MSIYAEGEGLNIHQAQRAESEKVSFTISPKSKGILYVTLSKYNRIPFQQQINITGKTNASFTSNQDGIESNGTQPTPVINEEFVQTMEESPVQHPRQNNPSRTSSQPTERDGEYKSAF